ARAALKHRSAGVRRNAVQVLPPEHKSVRAIIEGGLLKDEDGQVRLMALLALADLPPSAEAGAALADELNTSDRWLADAITRAAATHDAHLPQTLSANGTVP